MEDAQKELMKVMEFINANKNIFQIIIAIVVSIVSINKAIKEIYDYNPLKLFSSYLSNKFMTSSKRRKKFYETVCTTNFISWQNEILKKIYGQDYFINIAGKEYPVKCIKADSGEIKYPFKELCHDGIKSTKVQKDHKLSRLQKKYWRIINKTIHSPNLIGYAVENINIDSSGNIKTIEAKACTYKQNVLSSHILEYELCKVYSSTFQKRMLSRAADHKVLSYFKLRKSIHKNQSLSDITLKGKYRTSEFGVQALFVFRTLSTGEEQYKFRLIRRSGETAIRKDYWQFVPAGGFEIFEDEPGSIDIEKDFNVYKAVLREFLEEVYGVKTLMKFESQSSDDLIFDDPVTIDLENLINQNKAHFVFLGSVFDITILRHELSFLLIVDDPLFCIRQKMKDSIEGRGRSYTVQEVIKLLGSAEDKVNPGSAGLFKLALNSEFFLNKILSNIPIDDL